MKNGKSIRNVCTRHKCLNFCLFRLFFWCHCNTRKGTKHCHCFVLPNTYVTLTKPYQIKSNTSSLCRALTFWVVVSAHKHTHAHFGNFSLLSLYKSNFSMQTYGLYFRSGLAQFYDQIFNNNFIAFEIEVFERKKASNNFYLLINI